MSTEANKQLVRKTWEAIAKKDFDTFGDGLADDVHWTFLGKHRFAKTYVGKEDFLTNVAEPVFGELESDYKYHLLTMTAEADRVVLEAKLESRSKAGRDYIQEYCYVIAIADGKVKDVREYLDSELITHVFGPPVKE